MDNNAHRIGIYGGSFDPIHLGHLLVAETVRESIKLDRVLFIPAFQSPLKQEYPPIAGRSRLEMIQLAIGGHPSFASDDRELERGGISYTIDTLRELRSEKPQAEWFLIMGADSLVDFARWKEPDQLCQLAIPIIVARGGMPPPDLAVLQTFADPSRLEVIRQHVVAMPELEISSRDLRRRIRNRQSIRYQVPAAVEAYIESHGLYRE